MDVEVDEFCDRYPKLMHMASADAWPSIRDHGLLSTEAIADRLKLIGTARSKLLSEHRKKSVVYPGFVIRDQQPMNALLSKVLEDGTSPREWFELLNSKVFLWARRKTIAKDDRLIRFLRVYGEDAQIILELDSARFLDREAHRVSLCHINSGATRSVKHKRSRKSFVPFQDYSLKNDGEVAEVSVERSLPDIVPLLSRVYRVDLNRAEKVLFEQPHFSGRRA